MNFGKGYIPDVPDASDQHFARLGLEPAVPVAFSLKEHVIEVLDQGQTSSCVAHAWSQALRIADKLAGVVNPPLSSRLYLYRNARAFDGGDIQDQGTQLRSCARGLTKFGRPPESAWPFNAAHVNDRPPWDAYRLGYDYKGPAGYYRISTTYQIKQALANGKPVVGGASVANSIETYEGGIYDPDPNEPSIGGHALCFTGFDAESFEIVGSWGPGYGEHGFMRVSPRFAASFSDLWAVSLL